MNKLTLSCLVAYISLMLGMQTVYGRPYLIFRWPLLAMLAMLSAAVYFIPNAYRRAQFTRGPSGMLVACYLCLTFLTVIVGVSPIFSGVRWLSHAIMIVTFMVFVSYVIAVRDIQLVILVLRVGLLVFVIGSVLRPATRTLYDRPGVFRGMASNPNTMGQLAAMAGILWIHAGVIAKSQPATWAQIAVGVAVTPVILATKSRSAAILLVLGLLSMMWLYRHAVGKKVVWVLLPALIFCVASTDISENVVQFIFKIEDPTHASGAQLIRSRKSVWTACIDGFKMRPVLGWGFGADSDVPEGVGLRWSSYGVVNRDGVNDTLLMLEGCGLVGLGGYLLVIYLFLSQVPSRRQYAVVTSLPTDQSSEREELIAGYHVHVAVFILSAGLLVMAQFDNTILAAGNFMSVLAWFCAGAGRAMNVRCASAGESAE